MSRDGTSCDDGLKVESLTMKPVLDLACLGAALMMIAWTSRQPPLPTIPAVDLDRYFGTWYEIAHLPNFFQAACVSDTRATYRPDGENVAVMNQCRTEKGTIERIEGIAKVVAGSRGAKLRVSFFRAIYGDYWILDLDPDYRWVLVGEPSRKYAWILARSPNLDAATQEALLARAAALGFDRQAFVRTPHRGQSPS
jgi:apolipoprotein D and lipocalin family protein